MEVRKQEAARRTWSERLAAAVARFGGTMAFVYTHFVIYGAWLLINSGALPIVKPWDPFPFVMLAMMASVESIFLSTFILITQNRMQSLADRRSELDLQISLLTEHELTRVIRLLDEVAKHLHVQRLPEQELEEIKRDVNPAKVAQVIDKANLTSSEPS